MRNYSDILILLAIAVLSVLMVFKRLHQLQQLNNLWDAIITLLWCLLGVACCFAGKRLLRNN
jgi:uncharacterized membrane protein YeiH